MKLPKNGPELIAAGDGSKPRLIYDDGFFLLGQSWKQLEKQIAADCGLSIRTVRKHLEIAEGRGWIERIESPEGVGIRFVIPEVKP
jgi:hypothetical protein